MSSSSNLSECCAKALCPSTYSTKVLSPAVDLIYRPSFTSLWQSSLEYLLPVIGGKVVLFCLHHWNYCDLRRDFHWLPIRRRIVYKQYLMTYKAVHIGQPNYLHELIQPYQPVRTLRSFTSALLVIPFVRSDFSSDAFSVSAPTLWNNLHQDVRSWANQATFKSRLKSHLFFLSPLPSSHSMCLCPDSF